MGWQQEFRRAVALDALPEDQRAHITAHGLDPEVQIDGSDGYGCDTCGEYGRIDITVHGTCSCGVAVYASVDGEEDVAGLIRRITALQ